MNVLARVSFSLNIPGSVVEGCGIERSAFTDDEVYRDAVLDAWEATLKDEFVHYLDYMTAGEPDVEVDG